MLSRRDLVWGYTAQVLNIGLGLIMLPVIVRYMTTSEVGLWFVFVTIAGLAQLLELGFQPTLARNISYVYAGAQTLAAQGLHNNANGALNLPLLADLVAASRLIYQWITLLAALLLLVGGTWYISSLLQKEQNFITILAGWCAFVLGNLINFYYGYLNAFLQGRGDVTEANKVIIASRSIQVLLGVTMVVMGFGLLGLGLASLLSTIVSRVLARQYVYSPQHPEMHGLIETTDGMKRVTRIIWHNAIRFGVVLIGVFLIWRANILIASSSLGLADAASYGLAIQIFFLLNTVASVPFNLSLPKLNAYRAQNRQDDVYRSFSTTMATALIIYITASLMVLLIGNYFLTFIGSSTKLPNNYILSGMVVVFLLEINHGTCSNFITTGNKIPFVLAAIITGCCIVTGSIILAPIIGISGLVISQGLVQVVYNNWKWPLEVSKIFNVPYYKVILDGFVLLKNRTLSAL